MWKTIISHKILSGIVAVLIIIGIGNLGNSTPQQPAPQVAGDSIQLTTPNIVASPSPTASPSIAPLVKATIKPSPTLAPTLAPIYYAPQTYCGNGSYVNSDGQTICSPDYNSGGGGITCSDGTTSHSTHRQGACSHHGGIN